MGINRILSVFLLASVLVVVSCSVTKKTPPPVVQIAKVAPVPAVKEIIRKDAFFEDLMGQYPQYFDQILKNRKDWNVQIIYTVVDRASNGNPILTNYSFNLNPAKYFYPASTVKLPISILALQKLNELKIAGLDRNATMITDQAFSGQTPVYNDPSTPDGKPTVTQYIKKSYIVSDNDASNRLYEFLGQDYINEQLQKKGYPNVQILHRLGISLSFDENRHTNPVKFLSPQGTTLYNQNMQTAIRKYPLRTDSIGSAFYREGKLIRQPMDFSLKNRIGLADLHTILINLVFPNSEPRAQGFNLSLEDRNFLLKYMSQLPTETMSPPYSADTAAYWPSYCKFLLLGSQKGAIPKNIRIFNKVGDAYGQLTDVAYIVDFEKKIEFFLSATIYCNKDGILDDDHYDYQSIGFPFMKQLGQVIYNLELKRKRKNIPDLSPFIFDYDK
jgi:Beta-lactamase enzyme family